VRVITRPAVGVLSIRGRQMIQLSRILLPTDFSKYSGEATKYACALAEQFDATLHLLHVVPNQDIMMFDFGISLEMAERLDHIRQAAQESLGKLLDAEWAEGRTVVEAVEVGVTFVEILQYAKREEIDLIVIGTHGRTGLAHALMGSVAERVVRKSPCPVLTVRPEGHQFVMP